MYNKNVLIMVKCCKKCSWYRWLGVSLFLAHFYKVNYQCNVCLHKQTPLSFQNCFGVLFRLCQGKGFKRRFVISNVPAGKTTLCRGQHVARELQVEWPRCSMRWQSLQGQFWDKTITIRNNSNTCTLHYIRTQPLPLRDSTQIHWPWIC
jgi:hypothetical protein